MSVGSSARSPQTGPRRRIASRKQELKRDTARLRRVSDQSKEIEGAVGSIAAASQTRPNAMARLLGRVLGLGVETADMLALEVLSREWYDRCTHARYAGLTGSTGESGK